jgi:hypothetical protein
MKSGSLKAYRESKNESANPIDIVVPLCKQGPKLVSGLPFLYITFR